MSLFYAPLIGRKVVSLAEVCQAILAVPPVEEDGDAPLIDGGYGTAFIYALVARLKEASGEAEAQDAWAQAGLSLDKFVCSLSPMEPAELAADAAKHGLPFLAPSS